MDPVSDGCTGFQWAEWLFPKITACCTIHDTGGTDGTWHIFSDDAIPAELAAFVVASGDRSVGLKLPAGIAGLSTIWAGMTVLPHTP